MIYFQYPAPPVFSQTGFAPQAAGYPPTVETKTPGRWTDLYSKLAVDDGILDMVGTVNDDMYKLITAQLFQLGQTFDEIQIVIASGGGSVPAGMGIRSAMINLQNSGKKVGTTVRADSASMAAVLSASGTKGLRKISKRAKLMIHRPALSLQGVFHPKEFAIQNQEFQDCELMLAEVIAMHSGKSLAEVRKDMEYDHWLTAEEALAYGPLGLADEIIDDDDKLGLIINP